MKNSLSPNHKPTDVAILPNLLGLLIMGAVILGCVEVFGGRTLLEKTLTALANPCGLLWLLLLGTSFFLWRSGQRGFLTLTLGCWLLLTLAGNELVAQRLIGQLEAPYRGFDAATVEPFDVGIVLGGGTDTRLSGQAQASEVGDRVLTAARLFHAGKLSRIICTGTQTFRSSETDMHPRDEAAEILVDLAIPADRIMTIEGENTSQEMQQVKTWLAQQTDTPRIAVITSAFHLNRAMRLARTNGIEAEPIPSNFFALHLSVSPAWIIPDGNNLKLTNRVAKEYLAALLGR